VGTSAVARADYACGDTTATPAGEICASAPVLFALPPPSPPPPAQTRSIATMSIGGLTKAAFGDSQQKAFCRAVAKIAGVDPAAIVILELEDDGELPPLRRLLQDMAVGGATKLKVRFAVEAFDGSEADDVQFKITTAESEGKLAEDLRLEPALAAVTSADGVSGSFTIQTPPMPPPAEISPPPPDVAGSPTCAGLSEVTDVSGALTDGSTAAEFYSADLDCEWLIGNGDAPYVSVTFTRFDTEFEYDYVEIFDGRDDDEETSPSLGKFTGTGGSSHSDGPPLPNDGGPISSTQPFMFVKFHSDDATQARGWALRYTSGVFPSPPPPALPAAAGSPTSPSPSPPLPASRPKDHCHEPVLLTGDGGDITDGSLPLVDYLPGAVCIYLIRSSLSRVKVHFTRFDTELDTDFLKVYSADEFPGVEGVTPNRDAAQLFGDEDLLERCGMPTQTSMIFQKRVSTTGQHICTVREQNSTNVTPCCVKLLHC
jgi:hypothetical protein